LETLVTVHSWVRWLVLSALAGGAGLGLIRYRNKANWESSVFQLGVMTVDIQIAIGIVIWFERKGWNYSFFFKVLHPVSMLAALAVAHVGLAVAKRRSDARSYLLAGGAFVLTLVLIIGAIPWDRL
jgi:hypothetical protein